MSELLSEDEDVQHAEKLVMSQEDRNSFKRAVETIAGGLETTVDGAKKVADSTNALRFLYEHCAGLEYDKKDKRLLKDFAWRTYMRKLSDSQFHFVSDRMAYKKKGAPNPSTEEMKKLVAEAIRNIMDDGENDVGPHGSINSYYTLISRCKTEEEKSSLVKVWRNQILESVGGKTR
jgi:hypothetical protein